MIIYQKERIKNKKPFLQQSYLHYKKLPVLIFGETHVDPTTDNILKKLAKALHEKGYERYYVEAPQGMVTGDLPIENRTMTEMQNNGLEVRSIDVGILEEEERQNFVKHFTDPNSSLAQSRNSTMAWHYAHSEVPVVGMMGLSHMSEVQKKLVTHRPNTVHLENHYLCVYVHSKEPMLKVEKAIIDGPSPEDYPLGILEINTATPEGEDKAVELILKKIDEKKYEIEQSEDTEHQSPRL